MSRTSSTTDIVKIAGNDFKNELTRTDTDSSNSEVTQSASDDLGNDYDIVGTDSSEGTFIVSGIPQFHKKKSSSSKSAKFIFKSEDTSVDAKVLAFHQLRDDSKKRFSPVKPRNISSISTNYYEKYIIEKIELVIRKVDINTTEVQQMVEDDAKKLSLQKLENAVFSDFERGKQKSTIHYANERRVDDFQELKQFYGSQFDSVAPFIYQAILGAISHTATELPQPIFYNCPVRPITIYHHQQTTDGSYRISVKSTRDISTVNEDDLSAAKAAPNYVPYLCYEAAIEGKNNKYDIVFAQISYCKP